MEVSQTPRSSWFPVRRVTGEPGDSVVERGARSVVGEVDVIHRPVQSRWGPRVELEGRGAARSLFCGTVGGGDANQSVGIREKWIPRILRKSSHPTSIPGR